MKLPVMNFKMVKRNIGVIGLLLTVMPINRKIYKILMFKNTLHAVTARVSRKVMF